MGAQLPPEKKQMTEEQRQIVNTVTKVYNNILCNTLLAVGAFLLIFYLLMRAVMN
jgi:hypothetical protein